MKLEALPERLRALRTAAGLSQYEVARLLGMHRSTISMIEAGKRELSLREATQFAVLYQVSLHELAYGKVGDSELREMKFLLEQFRLLNYRDRQEIMDIIMLKQRMPTQSRSSP